MPRVTYMEADGTRHVLQLQTGGTVMRGAVQGGVQGILAECGGACSCATCHVYVDPVWAERCGQPSTLESEMLDWVIERRQNSRLACQIEITPALDGLIVEIPMSQS